LPQGRWGLMWLMWLSGGKAAGAVCRAFFKMS
jgi:hypothetical protein